MNNVKRLYRSEKEQMIAGVCSGLAQYFEVDPTIVRIVFIVLAFTPMNGVLLYILLWVVIPQESAVKNGQSHGDSIRANFEDMKEKTKHAFDKARQEAANAGHKAQETAEDVKEAAEHKADEVRETAENIADKLDSKEDSQKS